MSDLHKEIHVEHINIRTSISFMILRLVVSDCIGALAIIVVSSGVPCIAGSFSMPTMTLTQGVLLFLISIKIGISILIVLQWLCEYYEVRPDKVIHKSGIFFTNEKSYNYSHISELSVEQGTLGRIFNYGTIKLFDWPVNQYTYLYLIHNPIRYYKILKELIPEVDAEKHKLRSALFHRDESL